MAARRASTKLDSAESAELWRAFWKQKLSSFS